MSAFVAGSLDAELAWLDDLPHALFGPVVTGSGGDLRTRVATIAAWREALLEGRAPDLVEPWPSEAVARPVLAALQELGIARFCVGQEALVDALLQDVLIALERGQARLSDEIAATLRELEALERKRLEEEEDRSRRKERIDRAALRARARDQVLARISQEPDPALAEAWQERVRIWSSLAEVFDDLETILGLGWDLSRGVLRHVGWTEVARLSQIVAQLPQLRELVRTLGRLQVQEDGPSFVETVMVPVRRTEEEIVQVRSPLARSETRGLVRSDDLARMLPAEAALLTHPTLRLLWHARRIERSLLCYRVEGVAPERIERDVDDVEERTQRRPRPERGPIVVCLDTSGSMSGLPETVAKAVTLEALRVAHAEKRACYLYAFSGPEQVDEHELDLSPEGLGRLLALLGCSFYGGTDVEAPIRRTLARLKQERWKRADVLVVSDGEFPISGGLVQEVQRATEDGTRWHGLLVGGRSQAMARLCDPVHRFTDWQALTSLPAP